jgi:hypothetical protein
MAMSAGCAHSQPSTPQVHALRASQLERQWRLHRSAHATTPRAVSQAIAMATRQGGVELVGVSTYGAPSLAPAITLAVSEPASFLRHRLEPIVRATRPYQAAYIRVVDASGERVLEWYKTGSGGALSVRPGLQGCSPLLAVGLADPPPCPAH